MQEKGVESLIDFFFVIFIRTERDRSYLKTRGKSFGALESDYALDEGSRVAFARVTLWWHWLVSWKNSEASLSRTWRWANQPAVTPFTLDRAVPCFCQDAYVSRRSPPGHRLNRKTFIVIHIICSYVISRTLLLRSFVCHQTVPGRSYRALTR